MDTTFVYLVIASPYIFAAGIIGAIIFLLLELYDKIKEYREDK